jgi:hypothetical protein
LRVKPCFKKLNPSLDFLLRDFLVKVLDQSSSSDNCILLDFLRLRGIVKEGVDHVVEWHAEFFELREYLSFCVGESAYERTQVYKALLHNFVRFMVNSLCEGFNNLLGVLLEVSTVVIFVLEVE